MPKTEGLPSEKAFVCIGTRNGRGVFRSWLCSAATVTNSHSSAQVPNRLVCGVRCIRLWINNIYPGVERYKRRDRVLRLI